MTSEKVELIIKEVKKQITRLNMVENFTLFKADEFSFKNTVGVFPQGNVYNINHSIEIYHPLTGYRIVVNMYVEEVEEAAKAIIMILQIFHSG